MKRHIYNGEKFTFLDIDTGNHGAKILNHRGEYIHTQAFSIELLRSSGKHKTFVKEYLQQNQKPGDILFFVANSSNSDILEDEGLLIGEDTFILSGINKEDTMYTQRYDVTSFFLSTRYQKEVLGYIARALYNNDKKQYDKDNYDNIVLSLGLPANLEKNESFKNRVKGLFLDKSFTLHTVIGSKGNDGNDFEKLYKKVSVSIDKVFIYSQPFGTITSMALTDDGEYNHAYAGMLNERTICIDGGYKTLDIYRLEKGRPIMESINTFEDFGMSNIHDEMCDIWGDKNRTYKAKHNVRLLDESGATKFPIERGQYYSYVRSDIDNAWKRRMRTFTQNVVPQYNDFVDDRFVIITGGTGRYIFDRLVDFPYRDKLILAKTEYIDDDLLATVFANVEGYHRTTMRKMMHGKDISRNDFIEIEVKPVVV